MTDMGENRIGHERNGSRQNWIKIQVKTETETGRDRETALAGEVSLG